MRLHLSLTTNKEIVPFEYQHFLIGAFHKWMEWNEVHDKISLYSFSWLQGSKLIKNGFDFPDGGSWFISFWDNEMGKRLMKGIMNDPDVFCGMKVREIQVQDEPNFSSKELFKLASPVLIRKYDQNRKAVHLTYQSEEADSLLTKTLKKKMITAGLYYEVKVYFDKNYTAPKTKLVNIGGIRNKASLCPVIIEGSPEAIKFAWTVGVGHSTGCGFGSIY